LSPDDVEAYLSEYIPLSAGMDVEVIEASPHRVTLGAPLRPANLNHQSTAFGGSVAALAILAGWTQVHLRLQDEGIRAQTVIQSSSVHYDAPIHGDFQATSDPIAHRDWSRFTRGISKHGKGRVHVSVQVTAGGATAATFTGAYVALRAPGGQG
jgi:thioesterase domain-containing protein